MASPDLIRAARSTCVGGPGGEGGPEGRRPEAGSGLRARSPCDRKPPDGPGRRDVQQVHFSGYFRIDAVWRAVFRGRGRGPSPAGPAVG